jgi:hypothetical protein
MKTLILTSLFVVMALITAPTFGQTITFDENGNGTIDGRSLDYSIGPSGVDPVPPGPIPTLFYYLPFPVIAGDLQVFEPAGSTGNISDILRFISDPFTNTSHVYVYSDIETTDVSKDLADVGLPGAWDAIVVQVPEVGLEGGVNGAIYMPTPNQPGGLPTGAPITYNFISDVPEPATICLLAIGGLALLRRK